MSTQTIGIDTAKRVFFLHGEDARGKVVLRERLTRERLLPFLVNQPASADRDRSRMWRAPLGKGVCPARS